MSNVIVLAEQDSGTVVKATLSAITAAKEIAAKVGGGFDIAVVGSGVGGAASDLCQYGAVNVYHVDDACLEGYTAQAYAQAFHAAINQSGAKFIVAASTAKGKDCTPRVAARLNAGQASDIVAVNGDAGSLTYTRPMWAGNVFGHVKINTETAVLTIRTTEFDAASPDGGQSAITAVASGIDASSLRMKYLGLDAVESERPDLSEADAVVSGGRGLQQAENFRLVEQLADQLNAAIGASRAVVDEDWVPNDWQVGQTGKVVAPTLYIAVGISGAIQHLAGMKGSKTIVAINKDPEAPIFTVADYGLVADLFEVMPELTQKLSAR